MRYFLLLALCCWLLPLAAQRNKRAQTGKSDQQNSAVQLRNAVKMNSAAGDFSPAFYNDGLVYVSARHQSGPKDPMTGEAFYDLYFAPLDPNWEPMRPRSFSLMLNSTTHEGPVTFDQTGQTIYFTRSNYLQGVERTDAKGGVRLKIYEAVMGAMDWDQIRELPFNSDEYSCMHPTLSQDGRLLFFSSNRPGGFGGYDLYVAVREGRSWSAPYNLSARINTAGDEVFPFMHESGTLFFASNGYKGYGNYDLYMVEVKEGAWSDPINLGRPFNSEADDFGLILNEEGDLGFFSSNRPGGLGRDDIYRFEAPEGISGIVFPDLVTTTLAFYDEGSGRSIAGVALRVYERVAGPDGQVELLKLGQTLSSSEDGQLVFEREDRLKGEIAPPEELSNSEGKAYIVLDQAKSYLFSATKRGYGTKELEYRPSENAYNRPVEITLGREGCVTVDGYVQNQMGQALPQATVRVFNECTQRMQTMSSNTDGTFTACLDEGCDFVIVSELAGFRNDTARVTTKHRRGNRSLGVVLSMAPRQGTATAVQAGAMPLRDRTLRAGDQITLRDILYDFGSARIKEGAAGSLMDLASLMQRYPNMEVELISHTDCRGETDFNMRLSLDRAESARQFLVKQGIAADRIRAFGYGEAVPINDCDCKDRDSCTEEQHAENRRTELRVLRM